MKMPPVKPLSRRFAGFSLMELAVVLMIIGTLMSGVLVAVSQNAANNRITNAKAQLREIEEALYGFAQAYGRLPCPATDASSPANFEDPACPMHGFVPSGTLGIDGTANAEGLLVDPWQNPLRYSVITAASVNNNPDFTERTSIQDFFNNSTTLTNANMFRICEDNVCTDVLADTVPAVVMSLGPDANTYTSANEILNAGSQTMSGYPIKNDWDFVSTTFSEDNYDDQLIWLSPYVLFNRLVSAGKLP